MTEGNGASVVKFSALKSNPSSPEYWMRKMYNLLKKAEAGGETQASLAAFIAIIPGVMIAVGAQDIADLVVAKFIKPAAPKDAA